MFSLFAIKVFDPFDICILREKTGIEQVAFSLKPSGFKDAAGLVFRQAVALYPVGVAGKVYLRFVVQAAFSLCLFFFPETDY
jgi:hypothetical protein